jgi:hypothetical protein
MAEATLILATIAQRYRLIAKWDANPLARTSG